MKAVYNVSQARSDFSNLVNSVIFGGQKVFISRGRSKQPAAVIVTADEWSAYEAWRDARDAKIAKAALRRLAKTGEQPRPIAELWKKLGL